MRAILLCAVLAAAPAHCLELAVSEGVLQSTDQTGPTTVRLPERPWAEDWDLPRLEGVRVRRAYRVSSGARTTLQLMSPLREAILNEGYEAAFECADTVCGGFDFRFAIDLIGEPAMHVDLGDFRYFLAHKPDGAPMSVAVLTSRSTEAGFVHITEVFAPDATAEIVMEEDVTPSEATPRIGGELVDQLIANGRVVLEDLQFASGDATLSEGPYSTLEALADWLLRSEERQVVLVGHTDAVGSLETNTALSQKRAEAVATRLVDAYGVSRSQVSAEGAGYLSPRASNLSDTGRALNRRVEAVLLSTAN